MTLQAKLPEAIFFDWDGTLADSYSYLERAHNETRQTFGRPPLRENEFRDYFGQPRETLYPIIYGAENVEEAKKRFADYIVKNVVQLKPMPGAENILKACSDHSIVMGIISNKKAEFIHMEIKAFGWGQYFKSVMGAGEAAHDKPAPDPLLKAMAGTGHNNDNAWYVGDTDVDLQCAENAKCKAVFIAHDARSDQWIQAYKPFLIFKNCDEFAGFLLQRP